METIIKEKVKIRQAETKAHEAKHVSTAVETNDIWAEAEKARFGIIPLLLTVVACLGGIAAAFGTGYEVFQLGLIAIPTMLTLTLMLAVAPMKQIIYAGIICVLLDILVMIF